MIRNALPGLLLLLVSCSGGGGGSVHPLPVSGFAATQGDGALALSWTNPVRANFDHVVIRRSLAGTPLTPTAGVGVYSGLGTNVLDAGLVNATRYYYAAFAFDTAGAYSAAASADGVPNPAGSLAITFVGIGAGAGSHGIFDPSLAADPSQPRIWMSYSEVTDSVLWAGQNAWIRTRLASSDDAGATWTDAGLVVNPAEDVTLPFAPPNDAGTWESEVSSITSDPMAPSNERWKLVWHHYLTVNGVRHFEHGWIALRTAPDPTGPWSAERKLFAASLYDPANDVIIGPPEVQLDLLHPDLATTLVCTEPGLLATSHGLYVVLHAADGTSANGRIVLVEQPAGSSSWFYRGSFLVNDVDGPAAGVDGYSAPALFVKNGDPYLIATPAVADYYSGTAVFRITGLQHAQLERSAGVPVPCFTHDGDVGSFNGAAAYVEEATACGLLFGQLQPALPLHFEFFASQRNP